MRKPTRHIKSRQMRAKKVEPYSYSLMQRRLSLNNGNKTLSSDNYPAFSNEGSNASSQSYPREKIDIENALLFKPKPNLLVVMEIRQEEENAHAEALFNKLDKTFNKKLELISPKTSELNQLTTVALMPEEEIGLQLPSLRV